MPGQQNEVTFRFLAQPTDVNFGGKVHGGMAMKWIDQAGYACAVGWSGAYCVTVSVSGIQFIAPILIGDLVSVRARLIHTGTSSMHLAVDVLAQDLRKGEQRLATSCVMVFVALDSPDGKPTPVPRWEPSNEEDRRLQDYARRLMEMSKTMEQQVVALRPEAAPVVGAEPVDGRHRCRSSQRGQVSGSSRRAAGTLASSRTSTQAVSSSTSVWMAGGSRRASQPKAPAATASFTMKPCTR